MIELQFPQTVVVTHDPTSGNVVVDVGRCKDCKHWDCEPYATPRGVLVSQLDDAGRATCEVVTEQRVVGGLGEGGREPGPIWTAPDFGCVLFQSKVARTEKP